MTANLQRYIDGRAAALAAPIVADAKAAARATVAEAAADIRRKDDLIAELQRQATVRDRIVDMGHARDRTLAPLLIRLSQIRRDWPNLVDMEPEQAWREIQEIMALVPQEER
jgi:hypothetical protein